MYSNSKEQVSLEEAYRRVHLEEKEEPCDCEDNCDCENDCKWAKEGCTCNKCKACIKNSNTEENKLKESFLNESDITSAISAAEMSIAHGDNLYWNMCHFLAIVFGSTTAILSISKQEAAEIIAKIGINVHKILNNPTVKEKKQKMDSFDDLAADQTEKKQLADEILLAGVKDAINQKHGDVGTQAVTQFEKAVDELRRRQAEKR